MITFLEQSKESQLIKTFRISTNMDRRLIEAAHKGDVHELHNLIREDPMLFRVVELAGGETPLNIACIGGHVNFVKEVLNFRREFASELNQDGFSPLHIASFNGDIEIVKELIKIGSHLCLVKGKERRIPLHYAVAKGRVEVIRGLLSTSLDSITEVTARGETCFHLAVKNNRIEAFKILVDHAILHNKEEILNKKDEQGNSIFHLAALRKQYEVIQLLLDEKYALNCTMEVNSLNKRGLTPLDVLTSEGGDSEIEEMLRLAGAVRVEELNLFPHQVNSQNLVGTDESLSGPGQERRRGDRSKWPSNILLDFFKYNMIKDTPIKLRNTLLVIAILITTATYQAVLSPPGGVWQDDSWTSTNNSTNGSSTKKHTAGTSVMGTDNPTSYGLFLLYNSIGFYMSLHMLNFLTFGLPMQFELRIALIALTSTYVTCMIAITPEGNIIVLFIVMAVTMPIMIPILTKAVRNFKKLRRCAESRTVAPA